MQLTNILRDLDEDAGIGRLYLPREFLARAGITSHRPARGARRIPRSAAPAPRWPSAPPAISSEADAIMAGCPRRLVRAPRIMGEAYRRILARLIARGWSAPRARRQARQAPDRADPDPQFPRMTARAVHVIGAGLAGLSAALRLAQAGERVVLHEAGSQAGGRCRSYHDAALDMMIDNGNHVILSGNRSALAYLALIGATRPHARAGRGRFQFRRPCDQASAGSCGWATVCCRGGFSTIARRVPNTRARDYLVLARLLWRPGQKSVGELIDCSGALYERLLEPFLLATLNNEPALASARLAATLLRETIAAGGRTCRPLIAMDGLSSAFVDPALACLKARGATVQFGHELHAINLHNGRADSLDFGNDTVHLGAEDAVILAVPPNFAARLLPGLTTPDEFHAIANVHFRVDGAKLPAMTGVVHAHDAMDFFVSRPPVGDHQQCRRADGECRARSWRARSGPKSPPLPACPTTLPPWQVVRERRATIATDPRQESLRPGAQTAWDNVFLAGDWTATSLPPTIESAIRSGERAAALAKYANDATRRLDPQPRPTRSITRIDAAAAALRASQRADGHWVFELEADATIPAEYVLLTHYLGEEPDLRARAQDRRLSAQPAAARRRLAAVSRRRLRHQRQREGLFRAQDDRRRARRRAHANGARGDPRARRRGAKSTSSPACCWRSTASCRGAAFP